MSYNGCASHIAYLYAHTYSNTDVHTYIVAHVHTYIITHVDTYIIYIKAIPGCHTRVVPPVGLLCRIPPVLDHFLAEKTHLILRSVRIACMYIRMLGNGMKKCKWAKIDFVV